MKTEDIYRRMLDNAFDGIYLVSLERKIIYWNKAAERLTGYRAEEVVGRDCADNILVHVDEDGNSLCLGLCPLAASIADGNLREARVYLHHKDGHRVPVQVRVAPFLDDDGSIIGGVEIFTDASSLRDMESRLVELEKLAMHDKLTGLPNRTYMEQQLAIRLEEYKRYNWKFAVLFMDIDLFKHINDTRGHEAGDEVLKMVARTFLNNSRAFDMIGRWGGDEFLGLLVNVDQKSIAEIGERYRNLVSHSVIFRQQEELRVTCSVGVVMVEKDDTEKTLLNRVDKVMYLGKKSGGNCVFSAEALEINK